MSTTADVLRLAHRYFEAGSFAQAALVFRQVLQSHPNDADTLTHLATTLLIQGQFEEAAEIYARAVQLAPHAAAAHYNLGNALLKLIKPDEAIPHLEQSIRLNSRLAVAHNALGNALCQLNRLDEALASFQEAVRIQPNFANALLNIGTVQQMQGHLDEAVASIQKSLGIKPDSADALYNLGNVLQAQNRLDAAVACYRRALQIVPQFAEAHNNLGNTLRMQGKLVEAVTSYRQALRFGPQSVEARGNLGMTLTNLGQLQEAEDHCRQALRCDPRCAKWHSSLGTALAWQGRVHEALACQEESLRLQPDYAEARFNRALLWLRRGDFDRGWPEYEWRRHQPGFKRRPFTQPLWDGSDLGGRTILLHAEQGLGDTLQFIRFAALVKQRGGRVIAECQSSLLCLLAGAAGIDELVARGAALPTFDVQAPLLSLPGIFHASRTAVPARVPYLDVDVQLVERWRLQRVDGPEPSKLIGIAWQGSPTYRGDRHRSMPLRHFEKLARVKGVQLVSLQKGPGTEQLRGLANPFPVLDLEDRLGEDAQSLANIAAIMKNLDLVICCDTAICHLAGALAVPVWVALTVAPDWRWLLHGESSDWYPTMRLFRQTRYGEWQDVFDRMASALRND